MQHDKRLRLVVPSYNRGCQLECLLRSLFENCSHACDFSICVFYRHTSDEFKRGYEIVQQQFPGVEFVPQDLNRSFKQQFLNLVDESEFFGFIVDDMVVVDGFATTDRPFALLKEREDIFSLSLRLDAAKTFSQPINASAMTPAFDQDHVWRWKPRMSRRWRINRFVEKAILKSAFYDWSVPWALDGTVYRTSFFRQFFASIDDFENIPHMERSLSEALARSTSPPPNMIRYPRCKLVSLAMNSVDEVHDYPSLGLDPAEFNNSFMQGRRLDYRPFQKIVLHACHVSTEPFWL